MLSAVMIIADKKLAISVRGTAKEFKESTAVIAHGWKRPSCERHAVPPRASHLRGVVRIVDQQNKVANKLCSSSGPIW